MAREIDLTKPVSEEDEKYLRERYPEGYVNHLVARANGSLFAEEESDEEDGGSPEPLEDGGDPSNFHSTVVLEYLSQPDLTDEERDRVLEAEQEGLARPEIVGQSFDPAQPTPAEDTSGDNPPVPPTGD